MPDVSQAINAEYIAPGFLFVQVLYLLKVSFVQLLFFAEEEETARYPEH